MSDSENAERVSMPPIDPAFLRRRRISLVVAILVVAGLVVLGVLFARSIAARLSAARKIDTATALAREVDTDVVAIDLAVRSSITDTSTETKALAAKRIPKAREELARVVLLTKQAYPALNDDEREQALRLRATAEARLLMLSLADSILTADARAAAASKRLTAGWDLLVASKGLARDAAAQYNRLTKPAVARSNTLLRGADSRLASATPEFEAAHDDFPSLDTAPYLTYIATLRRLNTLAMQSNAAWLKGQTAQANVYTTRYNILEKQALQEAAALPVSPNRAVADAYDQATSRQLQDYVAARKKATEADVRLRQ